MDLGIGDAPDGDDGLVLGRISEQYGMRDAALAAYHRVERPGAGATQATSSRAMACRRLDALGERAAAPPPPKSPTLVPAAVPPR